MALRTFIVSSLILVSSILTAQESFLSFDDAKALSQDSNKNILLVFSGSDWCKPCIEFKKEILAKSSVQTYLNHSTVLLELDFPYKKKNKLSKEQSQRNSALADIYNSEGMFPRIVLVDYRGKPLADISYSSKMTEESFINILESTRP